VGNQSISQIPVHLEAEEHVREAVIDQRPGLSRRNVLKFGSAALAVGVSGATVDVLKPYRAAAQTPKRGGIFRICSLLDPVGFDPHQTIAFTTMTMLSLTHSRLLKVKAGPSVRPGTYPIETDVAESWTRPNDTTYVFKLRRGVRWHPKPPVDGRELTADDVKYTYERFLNIKGNGNRATLESVDKIEALDRYTVKFTLKEPFAWFLDALASTSTWLVAKEAVEKFGDLKRAEAVIGTGPWMLERYEPNVKLTFVRNPGYFVSGLPYANGVEVVVDAHPSSRFASWVAGKYDFGPEYQQVVRRIDLDVAKRRKPGLQTAEYVWFTGGYTACKLDQDPFKDVRVRRAMGRASNWREFLEASPFASPWDMAPRTRRCRPPQASGRYPSTSSPARGGSSTTKTFPPPSGCSRRRDIRTASRCRSRPRPVLAPTSWIGCRSP